MHLSAVGSSFKEVQNSPTFRDMIVFMIHRLDAHSKKDWKTDLLCNLKVQALPLITFSSYRLGYWIFQLLINQTSKIRNLNKPHISLFYNVKCIHANIQEAVWADGGPNYEANLLLTHT